MKKSILFLLAALCSTYMLAQTKVTGTVTSADDGQPIPFCNLQVKGTSTGEYTDENGKYSIIVPQDGVLIFSTIGFVAQEIPVSGRAVINVALKTDAIALDETIVVAYGTAKRGTYTGAASLVKNDAIKDMPATSFENALSGKVAGLQITQSSGQAGSVSNIRIRGIGSMNASNEPLYVIDGVPMSSGNVGQMSDYIISTNNIMSLLNPNDIESVTVLKDAAASALYGSRAANGVIMITTKKGRIGKPTVTLKASVGFTPSWATKNYEIASVEDNVAMLYEIFHDSETATGHPDSEGNAFALSKLNKAFGKHGYKFTTDGTGRYAPITIGVLEGAEDRLNNYYNWEDALFKTAVFQSYDLSVSGGSEQTSYYSSIAYTKDKGRAIDNKLSRISGRLNLNQKVGKYVEFMTNVNLANMDKSGYNDTRSLGSNYFMQTRNLLWGLYHPTDYKTGEPFTDRYGSLAYNSLYYRNEWDNKASTFKVQASEAITVKILPELIAKTIFSYDYTNTLDHIYYSRQHFNSPSIGEVTELATKSSKWVSSTTVNYNKEFAKKHNVNLLVGFEAEENKTVYQRAAGSILPSSSLHTVSTAGSLNASGYFWGNTMVSVLSKAEYNYDGRYFVSGSYRRDGSSKLGPDSRWGNFWSVAGSWKINNENFLRGVDAISNLRVRASYGVNGTLPTNNYGWRNLISYSTKYMGQPGASVSTLADKDLSWETNYTTNIALEFGLWDQRLYGTVEYFNRDSKDLLQDVPISTVTGFGSTLRNIGKINNRGLEVELGGDIIRNKDLVWDVSLTATFLKSEVKTLYGGEDIVWNDPTGGDNRALFIYREGEQVLSFYGKEWGGVDPANGKNVWIVNDEKDPMKGDFVYNGKGATYNYKAANQKIIGTATPKVYGGFNTSVTWKGLSLGLNFIYKLGAKLYDGAEKDIDDDGYYWERIRSANVAKNRWITPGQSTNIPRLSGLDLRDPMESSTRHLHAGDFLRLKTISLGYTLPRNIVSKIGLSNARVYFNGTNLLTWAAYKEVDPEVNTYGTRGWETPFGKTYTFGVELSF